MSVSVAYASQLSLTGTFTGTYVSAANNTITLNGLDESGTYTGSTSPAVSKYAANQKALSSGTATLDLTSLPGVTADETVTMSGLKVQFLKLRNLSTNANKLTVAKGASNGYQLDGATTWSVVLAPGQSVLFQLNGAADTVGGSNKTIDITGTGAQVLEYEVVAG